MCTSGSKKKFRAWCSYIQKKRGMSAHQGCWKCLRRHSSLCGLVALHLSKRNETLLVFAPYFEGPLFVQKGWAKYSVLSPYSTVQHGLCMRNQSFQMGLYLHFPRKSANVTAHPCSLSHAWVASSDNLASVSHTSLWHPWLQLMVWEGIYFFEVYNFSVYFVAENLTDRAALCIVVGVQTLICFCFLQIEGFASD